MTYAEKHLTRDDYHSHRTRDHETIRSWAEVRGGRPAVIEGTQILRVDFSEPEEKLSSVTWDEFFKTFDARRLEFLYQVHTQDGQLSRFRKFVARRGLK